MNDVMQIINKATDYFNKHDLDGLVSCFAEDIVFTDMDNGKVVMKGRDQVKEFYRKPVQVSKNHIDVDDVFISGNKVIEHEILTSADNKVTKALIVSEVENGLIHRCWWSIESLK